jgi:hypothetical protein
LIPQCRDHVAREDRSSVSLEGQQQVLRTTFPAVRESVQVLIGERMDKLTRQFAATHDLNVKAELEHLSHEPGNLSAPWVFISQ